MSRSGEANRALGLTLSAAGRAASAAAESFDRAPGPSDAHAPAARASSPLGDFARRDSDCYRVDKARETSPLRFDREPGADRVEDFGRTGRASLLKWLPTSDGDNAGENNYVPGPWVWAD